MSPNNIADERGWKGVFKINRLLILGGKHLISITDECRLASEDDSLALASAEGAGVELAPASWNRSNPATGGTNVPELLTSAVTVWCFHCFHFKNRVTNVPFSRFQFRFNFGT